MKHDRANTEQALVTLLLQFTKQVRRRKIRLNYRKKRQSRYWGTTQSVRNSMSQTLRTLPRGFPIISCSTHYITALIIIQFHQFPPLWQSVMHWNWHLNVQLFPQKWKWTRSLVNEKHLLQKRESATSTPTVDCCPLSHQDTPNDVHSVRHGGTRCGAAGGLCQPHEQGRRSAGAD